MSNKITKGFGQLSGKHVLVDKANTTVIIAAAAAAATVVFALFASKSLVGMIGYQNKVIDKRKTANQQLEQNIASKDQLVASYAAFNDTPESVIGTPDKNSKIILDALPSKYDFPAIATSLDGIVTNAGMAVETITGSDLETTAIQSSVTPIPVAIPFELTAKGDYASAQRLIQDLHRSIRPFKIFSVSFDVSENGEISISIVGETYYQPSKELGIEHKKVDKNGKFIENSSAATGTTGSTAQTGGASQ